jgi:hypothetical protein
MLQLPPLAMKNLTRGGSEYDFSSITPEAGATDIEMSPTLRFEPLWDAYCWVHVSTDSFSVFNTVPYDGNVFHWRGCVSALQIPPGVLEGGTKYYWMLVLSESCTSGSTCPHKGATPSNYLRFISWFTTSNDSG